MIGMVIVLVLIIVVSVWCRVSIIGVKLVVRLLWLYIGYFLGCCWLVVKV